MPFATVGTSAAALGADTVKTPYGVYLVADQDNAGSIHIGQASSVTADGTAATDGLRLDAGDDLFLPPSFASDLSQIFAIATQASQKLYYILPNRTA